VADEYLRYGLLSRKQILSGAKLFAGYGIQLAKATIITYTKINTVIRLILESGALCQGQISAHMSLLKASY
jgi:hypothetical protein